MKKIVFLALFSLFLFGVNTNKKILVKQQALKYQIIEKSKMNKKLDSLISALNKQKTILNNIDKEMNSLNQEVFNLKKELSLKQNNIDGLKKEQQQLQLKKDEIQQSIINYFAHNYYLSQSKVMSIDDLINEEVVKTITNITKKRISNITKSYVEVNAKSDALSKKIAILINKKLSLEAKKREILILKLKNKKELAILNKKVKDYRKMLQDIIVREQKFQNDLARLKLIRQSEIKKERELETKKELARQQEISRQKASLKNRKSLSKVRVRKYGSSYMRSRIRRYRGKRTISPLASAIVTKKFGTYIDPIYKIKVYNDSITLKAKKNSLVKSIFNGRVVYVGKSSNGYMIVIKHLHRLYSIYANLSKVSPYIKKGYRVKKGDIIARISNHLIFEITYKDMPINPLDVIKLQ